LLAYTLILTFKKLEILTLASPEKESCVAEAKQLYFFRV
jgi:hypothetical protein